MKLENLFWNNTPEIPETKRVIYEIVGLPPENAKSDFGENLVREFYFAAPCNEGSAIEYKFLSSGNDNIIIYLIIHSPECYLPSYCSAAERFLESGGYSFSKVENCKETATPFATVASKRKTFKRESKMIASVNYKLLLGSLAKTEKGSSVSLILVPSFSPFGASEYDSGTGSMRFAVSVKAPNTDRNSILASLDNCFPDGNGEFAELNYSELPISTEPWCFFNNYTEKISLDFEATNFLLPSVSEIKYKRNAFALFNNAYIPDNYRENGNILIGKDSSGNSISISSEELLSHMTVLGRTGSGKGNFLRMLISEIKAKTDMPVLVLSPLKSEFNYLENKGFSVFSPRDGSLHVNMFAIPKGVTCRDYKRYLSKAFSVAFSAEAPLPMIIEEALDIAYSLNGWTDSSTVNHLPGRVLTLTEFITVFKSIVSNSSYSSDVKKNISTAGEVRLMKLAGNPVFTSRSDVSVADRIDNCVYDLGLLMKDDKKLLASVLLLSVRAKMASDGLAGRKRMIILDEAHILCSGNESERENFASLLEDCVSECRGFGYGIVISDQSPITLGHRLINSVKTKINLTLDGEEAEYAAKAASLSEEETESLHYLSPGEMIFSNGDLQKAVPLYIPYLEPEEANKIGNFTADSGKCPHKVCDVCPFKASCEATVRERSKMLADRLFFANMSNLSNAEGINTAIQTFIQTEKNSLPKEVRICTLVHFFNKASIKRGKAIPEKYIRKIIGIA